MQTPRRVLLRLACASTYSLVLVVAALRTGVLAAEPAGGGITSIVLRLLDAVGPDLRKGLSFEFDDAERKDWSNLPTKAVPRKGVALEAMDDASRRVAHELLRASLSSQGYLKAAAIIHRETVLLKGKSPVGAQFGPGKYYLGVFGNPASDKRWGWQFDGHHLALNFTIVNGTMTGAPALWGAQPDEIETGDEAGWSVFGAERAKGFAVLESLTAQQRSKAILSEKLPAGIFTGPKRDKELQTIQGLPASAMTAAQQALLWRLIEEYVNNQPEAVALAHRRKIERDGIGKVHFAWMGSTSATSSVYYRVHGPSILIEYDNTGNAAVREQRNTNHVHSMFRDPSNDYGEDLLKRHYQSSPHGK